MESEFDMIVDKVIIAIQEINPSSKKEDIHKQCLIYFIMKACENEEIFLDNLCILDKYSQNGVVANYQKKMSRKEDK